MGKTKQTSGSVGARQEMKCGKMANHSQELWQHPHGCPIRTLPMSPPPQQALLFLLFLHLFSFPFPFPFPLLFPFLLIGALSFFICLEKQHMVWKGPFSASLWTKCFVHCLCVNCFTFYVAANHVFHITAVFM